MDGPHTYQRLADEALMLRYRDGELPAFEPLYQRHKGGVYRYLLRGCGSNSLADELFQDVWLSLVKARERYTPSAKFATYLYRIAHNRLIDYYRQHGIQYETALLDDEGDESDALHGATPDNPEQIVSARQQAVKVLDVIDNLPIEQREAFLLFEEGGLSVDEIAEATSVNKETAKSRLRYAFNKLRRALEQ
jgi:RNA polymerase sigma-70 factor, ECF subfamily